ncbi:MAG TPA: PQQ-binding-like beta-propeller repeat protein, partial [Gemmataceae bacterium]|nr:PQQ-binding-like beta-propeller repeat protein [Gemmataceae bacterium]
RDGKTGADFYNELATDKRFLPYLDVPAGMPGKVTRVEESRTVNQPNRILFTFEPEDDRLPYFQRYRVALDTNFNAFKLIDRKTGEEKWSQNISRSNYFQQFMGYNLPNMRVRHPFYGFGHLVVLNLGHLVFGTDPINQKVLWEKSLFGSQGMPQQSSVIVDPHDGQLVILYSDNFQQKLGYPGPVEAAYMAMVTRDGLVAFDPVSGKTLWTRSDVSPRSQLFGDDKYVYLVETNPDGTPAASRAFRASDGVTVNLPDFAPLYGRRVHVHGGKILLTDTDPQGGVTLRLYDVRSGKDLWSQKFAAGAVALQTEDPNLAGMVEPDGKVTVVDLHTRKVTMQGSVDPKHTAKAQAVYLLEDSLNYYVAVNGPIDPNVQPFGPPRSAFQPGTGVRALPVNGMFYAFERRTGKVKWYAEVQNQMVVMEHFKGLPMVLFASVYQKWAGGVNRFVIQVTEVKSFDKRSGKRIYDPDQQMNNGQQFFALNVDQRKVEMVSYNQRLTFHLPSGASDGGAKDPPGGGGIRPQPGQGIGQGQGGLQPGGGIRVRPRPPIIRQPLQPLPPQQRPLEKK